MQDKNKVAKVIADMFGVSSYTTPEQAVNSGLKAAKNNLPKELMNTLKKMLDLATEVGIKYDKNLVPKNLQEGAIEVETSSVMSGSVDVMQPAPVMRYKEYIKKKTAPHFDNHEDDPHTEVGSSISDVRTDDDDQLRRRKVDYKVNEEVEDDTEELSDDELEDIADDVDDEDDILDVYDDDELAIVDDETGEEVDDEDLEEIDESVLLEVLSKAERMRAKIRFMKYKSRRQRKLQIALKKRSDTKTLLRRARKLAVKLLKKRLLKKDPKDMTIAEKERAEKLIQDRRKTIDRLAQRLLPRVRKIESERLSRKAKK